ncbi:unnamed protein product [Blepharisma stoltei]|uniref:Uncharacterized protein n=1 Tax=Blepharisma stoltei TaxID=1481888 RepID=A0AAU9J6F3_9CILI|nr:unnamed protein product [Blepharisma stoltei]
MEFNEIFSSLNRLKKDIERQRRQRTLNRNKSRSRSTSPINNFKTENIPSRISKNLDLDCFSIPKSREELLRNYGSTAHHSKLKAYKIDATEILVGIIKKFLSRHLKVWKFISDFKGNITDSSRRTKHTKNETFESISFQDNSVSCQTNQSHEAKQKIKKSPSPLIFDIEEKEVKNMETPHLYQRESAKRLQTYNKEDYAWYTSPNRKNTDMSADLSPIPKVSMDISLDACFNLYEKLDFAVEKMKLGIFKDLKRIFCKQLVAEELWSIICSINLKNHKFSFEALLKYSLYAKKHKKKPSRTKSNVPSLNIKKILSRSSIRTRTQNEIKAPLTQSYRHGSRNNQGKTARFVYSNTVTSNDSIDYPASASSEDSEEWVRTKRTRKPAINHVRKKSSHDKNAEYNSPEEESGNLYHKLAPQKYFELTQSAQRYQRNNSGHIFTKQSESDIPDDYDICREPSCSVLIKPEKENNVHYGGLSGSENSFHSSSSPNRERKNTGSFAELSPTKLLSRSKPPISRNFQDFSSISKADYKSSPNLFYPSDFSSKGRNHQRVDTVSTLSLEHGTISMKSSKKYKSAFGKLEIIIKRGIKIRAFLKLYRNMFKMSSKPKKLQDAYDELSKFYDSKASFSKLANVIGQWVRKNKISAINAWRLETIHCHYKSELRDSSSSFYLFRTKASLKTFFDLIGKKITTNQQLFFNSISRLNNYEKSKAHSLLLLQRTMKLVYIRTLTDSFQSIINYVKYKQRLVKSAQLLIKNINKDIEFRLSVCFYHWISMAHFSN